MTAAPDAPLGSWRTLRRGLQLSPELRVGLPVTLLLALATTAGRVVVPVAIQLTIDRGLLGPGGADLRLVAAYTAAGLAIIAVTAAAGYLMIARLVQVSETALSNLRVRAFRHIHDLSMLHHADEHRGALVSRVTADVDEISRFVQWGAIILIVNVGQLLFTTAIMLVYSWQLTVVVLATFVPLVFLLRWFQGRLSRAYDIVRTRVGETLTAVSESVIGAAVVRAYGIEERTNERIVGAVDRQFDAAYRAHRMASFMLSSGEVFAALATAGIVILGVLLGVGGDLSAGRLISFLFLISLFVSPIQIATEVLDQAQTAIAGWRRVLGVLDTPADVADPAAMPGGGQEIPPGPIAVRFENVSFTYPSRPPMRNGSTAQSTRNGSTPQSTRNGSTAQSTRNGSAGKRGGENPPALDGVDLEISAQSRVAIVGETGSGKTTFAKLLTRLMDPSCGRVSVNGTPIDQAPFAQLRRRIVMVPQGGFLFNTTIEENVRQGRPGSSAEEVRLAFGELGLADWLEALPDGLSTRVGERGEALSIGERQLVALARAYIADPDLLVLDEATSSVDPATEVRVQQALDNLARGRTAIAIAHRLSTAQAADEILVFHDGRVVQRGSHEELTTRPGVYADLHADWVARPSAGTAP